MLHTRKTFILSAALVLGSALGASAADLYGGGLKDAPTMAAMPAPSAGWYVRADGGYNWYTDPSITLEDGFTAAGTKMDGAWSVGGGIGRYFGRGFRGDITVDHLFDADTTTSIYECNCYVGETKFDFSSTVVLANIYYDFNRGGRFVPYIGAGVGFAHNETSSGTIVSACGCDEGSFGKGSSNNFAAAAMAGVSWKIRGGETTYVGGLKDAPVAVSSGNALWLDVGYRFLYLGDAKTGDIEWAPSDVTPVEPVDPHVKNLMAHQIRVGLRYDLN
jgi:opacity protein-like surface antigen